MKNLNEFVKLDFGKFGSAVPALLAINALYRHECYGCNFLVGFDQQVK